MPKPPIRSLASPRAPRGTPAATRTRLVTAAAGVFNRDGYHGTDSNRIARAAGYGPGTFYKHFPDKRAILLAAYEEWVNAEWATVEHEVRRGGTPATVAARIVDLVLASHRRWRGLRSSVLGLVALDPMARQFYRRQRRRQLRLLREMRGSRARPVGGSPRTSAQDAVLLFTLERTCDAIANGELRDLGVGMAPTVRVLRELVHQNIAPAG